MTIVCYGYLSSNAKKTTISCRAIYEKLIFLPLNNNECVKIYLDDDYPLGKFAAVPSHPYGYESVANRQEKLCNETCT